MRHDRVTDVRATVTAPSTPVVFDLGAWISCRRPFSACASMPSAGGRTRVPDHQRGPVHQAGVQDRRPRCHACGRVVRKVKPGKPTVEKIAGLTGPSSVGPCATAPPPRATPTGARTALARRPRTRRRERLRHGRHQAQQRVRFGRLLQGWFPIGLRDGGRLKIDPTGGAGADRQAPAQRQRAGLGHLQDAGGDFSAARVTVGGGEDHRAGPILSRPPLPSGWR